MRSAARILVVDDELLNRRLIQALLGPEGYELILCDSAEAALRELAAGGIDLVLSDVLMPGIDGIELCRRIRQELDQPLLPVVLVSALIDATSRTRGKEAGADDFLTKPIHEAELLVRVRNLLLLRTYYILTDAQRLSAQRDAKRWKLASDVATSVAGCLDYDRVTERVFERLRAELHIESAALFIGPENDQELLASAGADIDSLRWIEAIPVVVDGAREGVFLVGRAEPFDDDDRCLLHEVQPHIANAIVHVRAHLATVSRLLRAQTDREHAEAALQASEERHRILFDASPIPIWVFDPNTLDILGVNDALARVLGYTREELLEMQVSDCISPEDVRRYDET